MNGQIKKKHHYIPRFYIKGFCDVNGNVWQYKKSEPDSDPIPINPKRVAFKNRLYEMNGLNADEINTFEDTISKYIEAPSAKILIELLKSEKLPNLQDREILANLIALQFIRTPSYKEHFSNILETSYSSENTEIKGGILSNINSSSCVKQNTLLRKLLKFSVIISNLLLDMHWCLIKTTDDLPFIISDNIFRIYNPNFKQSGFWSIGLLQKDSEVVFPLSKDFMLIIVNRNDVPDGKIYEVKENPDLKQEIKKINRDTYLCANKFVFASSNSSKLKRCFKNISNKILKNDG